MRVAVHPVMYGGHTFLPTLSQKDPSRRSLRRRPYWLVLSILHHARLRIFRRVG